MKGEETEEASYLNLRKWMRLFGLTILLGGAVSLASGLLMASLDPGFEIAKPGDWLYNATTMFLSGLTLGAFAHMGFFAYLTLNYIARSIFKRPYLWVTFQGFVTAFVLLEVGLNMYDTNFPDYAFWAVPVVLMALSTVVAWRKVRETSSGAWVPSLFFMIAITVLEGNPGFRSGQLSSLVYMMLPLFICNTYQLLQLHRLLRVSEGGKAPLAEAG